MRTQKYLNYMQSPAWKNLRKRILKVIRECVRCGSGSRLHVHHGSYDRLGKELDTDLFVLCEKCHRKLHARYGRRKAKGDWKPLLEFTREFISEFHLLEKKLGRWNAGVEEKHLEAVKKVRKEIHALNELFRPMKLKPVKQPLPKKNDKPLGSYLK